MTTGFINTFFETISNKNYRDEFSKSIKNYSSCWEDLADKETYDILNEKAKTGKLDIDGYHELSQWEFYIEYFSPRIVNTSFNYDTEKVELIILSLEELEINFLKGYIGPKCEIFVEEFSHYNDYALANSNSQTEYLNFVEKFKFHFKSKLSTVQYSNQFHIIKSILEGLKSYRIFFDSKFEFKIIDPEFLQLKYPLSKFKEKQTVIINETQIFKPIEAVPSAIAIIEPLLDVIPSPMGENNQIITEKNEKKSLDYYMKSDLKLEILTINLYIEYLVNFTITKNKTGVFFMTEECLINSIERIFKGNNNAEKAKIQYDKGEFGFVIQLFYLLYRKITHGVAFPRLTFQIMISTNFEFDSHEISTDKIDSHFRNGKGKNEWKLKDTKK